MALKGKFKRNNTNFKAIKSVLSHLRCSKLFKNFLDFPDVRNGPHVDFQNVDFGFMLPKRSSRHFLRYHGLSYFFGVAASYNPCSRLNDKSIKCQDRVVVPSEFSSARVNSTW